MKIGQREIGGAPSPGVYIIAELGVNHDGSLRRALDLTRAAADAGADAIKLQLFTAGRLLGRAARLAAYQRRAGETDPAAMLRRLEMPARDMHRVVDAAHHAGLHAIVTVFSVELVPHAATLACDAFKTASPDIVHRPLLESLAQTGRPLIISTGAADASEVARALRWLDSAADRVAVLQCVSSYPTTLADAALDGIGALRRMTDCPVGYSDHTRETQTGALAVAAGARILEKHLTYDRAAEGPDHAASLDAASFRTYVALAREAAAACRAGDPAAGVKRFSPLEHDVRTLSRQSITLRRDVVRGKPLRTSDLTFKRPGAGLPPHEVSRVIGRRAARALRADDVLHESDLLPGPPPAGSQRTIAVVTGTRAEFGLLVPVMHAIQHAPGLTLRTIVAGSHLLPPARTIDDVRAIFPVDAVVPMQRTGRSGRIADAAAVARGISGFARALARCRPDGLVVLGDRIEAFAAATAASIAGTPVAHIHGGDRAEGVADEAMRHAITKLSHLHFAATSSSAARIIALGEPADRVFITGSPAIDGLGAIRPMRDSEAARLGVGDPRIVVLLHPSGLTDHEEGVLADAALDGALRALGRPTRRHARGQPPILCLLPNHDPGRDIIVARIESAAAAHNLTVLPHLPRDRFLSLLKRLAGRSGVLLGNSSAGLIECAAIGLRVINIGPRQRGRESAPNVTSILQPDASNVATAITDAFRAGRMLRPVHPYGSGRSGEQIASILATFDLADASLLRKRNTF